MEPATPLSNNDFRKMLATPRRDTAATMAPPTMGSGGFAKPAPKQVTADDKRKREKSKQWKELQEKKQQDQAEHDARFRDRAKERREGKNADYDDEEQLDQVDIEHRCAH
jgi:IK cytokine